MARFVLDPKRVNHTIESKGKEYELRVLQRSQAIFSTLLGMLPSNYKSTIQGPNYTNELKSVALELSRIELALEDLNLDSDYRYTRSEFLYSIVGYLCFLNGRLPDFGFNDEEFRKFLLNLIKIYFKGSIPTSIQDAVALFTDMDFQITENFLLVREGAAGLDISDQFGFLATLEVEGNNVPANLFSIQSNIRTLVDIIRPAHTLFRIRYLFRDTYTGDTGQGVLDQMKWRMGVYYYDDARKYWGGVRDVDRLGVRTNTFVQAEPHSSDF